MSSTFKDFAEERDLLVKKVFPELRRLCRERQVELVDVDLRWGITEEEAQQGKVLPICLQEINRARPYFMGFIGERYGWVPNESQYPEAVIQQQPWIEEHRGGKSVTELEMLHGVLNNPDMAGRAYFYFRDTKYSNSKGGDYEVESPEHAAKLEDLRERIRASKFPVVENYPDPEAVAEQVRNDLCALIEEEFPEEDVPDALTLERMRHEAYGAARRKLYLGGDEYFKLLDDAVAMESEKSIPVLVTAEAGLGKSALISNWLVKWRKNNPDALVFLHHFSASSDSVDPVDLLYRLMEEVYDVTAQDMKPENDPEKLLDQLPIVLATMSSFAVREKCEWLIVLDGLDKINGHEHLRWFPRKVPEGLKLVVSCSQGRIEETLQSLLDWERVQLEPFSEERCREFIGTYLGNFHKTLPEGLITRILDHPLCNRPQWLLTLLEELRLFGVHEEVEARLITLLSDPPSKKAGEEPTIDDIYEQVLARIEVDIEEDYEVEVLKAIWASFDGLARSELLELTGMTPAKWAEIQNILDENLFESGGQITFGNQFIRKAVEDMHLPGDEEKRSVHRWLGEWFDKREVTLDVAQERVHQWKQAGDRNRLRACLLEQEVFKELYSHNNYAFLRHWVELGDDVGVAYEKIYGQWKNPFVSGNLGLFLSDAGYYGKFTEKLIRRELNRREKEFGPNHSNTLLIVGNLGELLMVSGDLEGAEKLYLRQLEENEKQLGPNHQDTLCSVDNLGILFSYKGDLEGSEGYFQRAFKTSEKTFGPDHPQTVGKAHNLGVLLLDKGDLKGAEKLLLHALRGEEKQLGPDHPTTLGTVSNLANLEVDKGDLDSSEKLYIRALKGRERALGIEHPDTLMSVYNLAGNFLDRARQAEKKELEIMSLNEAEKLYLRALEGREKLLGGEHWDTLHTINNLAIVFLGKDEPEAALKILRNRNYEEETYLGFTLACSECLAGNLEEAKRVILIHLKAHPEEKENALRDEDLAPIRGFIETL